MVTIHGTCVLVSGIGVLLRGASGSGKSDVALRLIDGGALLVADDRVELHMAGDGKVAAAVPPAIAGLLEVRGIGILTMPFVGSAGIGLVVDLVGHDEVERLPEVQTVRLLDVPVPRLALAAFDASTPAKLRAAVSALTAGTLGEVPALP